MVNEIGLPDYFRVIETILKLDEPTERTGLIYPRAVVEEALAALQKKKSPNYAVLGAPEDGQIHIDRVIGIVERLFIEGNELKAEIRITEKTPCGSIYVQLKKCKCEMCFLLASTGFVDENNVVSGMQIICVWADSVASKPKQ